MKLPPHAEWLLQLLLWDFRIALLAQLVGALRAAGVPDDGSARRIVRLLVGAGLVGTARVLARPLADVSEPLYRWDPAEGPPDHSVIPHVVWVGQSRWARPLSAVTVLFASPRAVRLFGGVAPGKVKAVSQTTHDLHVTEVRLLHFGGTDPSRSWVSEDRELEREPFRKTPDGVVYDLTGPVPRRVEAQEIVGLYPEEKLRGFFADMEFRSLPFRLW